MDMPGLQDRSSSSQVLQQCHLLRPDLLESNGDDDDDDPPRAAGASCETI